MRHEDEDLVAAWCMAVRSAYKLAYGGRLQELRDRRPNLLDARGLNPYSLEVGRIQALQEILPYLRDLEFDPVLMRVEAKRDAEVTFAQEVLDAARQT